MWLLLALVWIFLVFGKILGHGFVNWDDHIYVSTNALVTDPAGAPWLERLTTPGLGYPLPLPVLLYRLAWVVGEGAAWPFHALSLLVHGLNLALVFALVRRMGLGPLVAATLALGFAVHPLVVEPVAWVSGLKDLLMTTGVLLALGFVHRPGLALMGVVLALASKPTAVGLGVAMLFGLWCKRQRGQDKSESVPASKGAWVVAVLALALGVGLAWFTSVQEGDELRTTLDTGFELSRFFGATGLAISHLILPVSLAPIYGPEQANWAIAGLGLLAIFASLSLAWGWRSRNDSRLAWLAMLWLAWLPVSNLRPLVRFTADSYAYLPWACLVMLLAATLSQAPKWALRRRAFAFFAIALASLACWFSSSSWRDSVSLWRAAYEANASNAEIMVRYGDALGRFGERKEEMLLYFSDLETVALAPKIPAVIPRFLESQGELAKALEWYERGFGRELAQEHALYWAYVEFVVRNPGVHPRSLDAALRHALELYLANLQFDARASQLTGQDWERLVQLAAQQHSPALAESLASFKPS